MFNDIVLDVVIGLVFIYLLYSLLVTVSTEFFSNQLGIRPRLLRFAIERMLNDGYYQKMERRTLKIKESLIRKKRKKKFKNSDHTNDHITESNNWWEQLLLRLFKLVEGMLTWWWAWQRRFLLYESDYFKRSFAGKFYDYSSIKYLSKIEGNNKRWFSNSKPSYFSSENFADTVVNILKDKGHGDKDENKVDFCLTFNTQNIQPETLQHIRNLWDSSKEDIKAFKLLLRQWFDETMDRTNGWYKQKMQMVSLLLGFILAAAFNVNSIEITRILSKDKEARAQLVNMSVQITDDTSPYNDFVHDVADSIREQSVDSVYALLRKDLRAANAVLGLGWDFASLQKDKRCEIDSADEPMIFNKLTGNRSLFKDNSYASSLSQNVLSGKVKRDSIQDVIRVHVMDSLIIHGELQLAENDSVKNVVQNAKEKTRAKIKNDLVQEKKIKRLLFVDSIALSVEKAKEKSLRDIINSLTGERFLTITTFTMSEDNNAFIIEGQVAWSIWAKFWFWLGCVFNNFIGLFITSVALSFGAPFWFDILSKIVSLRQAGVKPEEKVTPKKTLTETSQLAERQDALPTQKPEPKGKDRIEEVLLKYDSQIRSIAGVKSIFTFIDPKTKTKNIQINVVDQLTEVEIVSRFSKLTVDTTSVIPRIKITGKAITHQGHGMISLRGNTNNQGSLGLVLKRKYTDSLHILSCWHVMKDLRHPTNESSTIVDHKDIGLAERWAGGIRGPFDYALAKCFTTASINSNSFIKKNLQSGGSSLAIRAIIQEDIDNQIAVKYLDFLTDPPTIKTGIIFTDSTGVELEYPDMTRTVTDVLVLTESLESQKTISKPGNSGSVIFDSNNRALGMIIGGDLDFTYAIKLSNVINIHKEMTIN